MESFEEKNEKRKMNKGGLIAAILVIAVVGGGYAAMQAGLIPGFGAGSKTANELKADIEALKGPNIEAKIIHMLETADAAQTTNPAEAEKFKNEAVNFLKNDADASFDYTGLATSSGEGKGTVTLTNPSVSLKSLKDNGGARVTAPKFIISRDAADRDHYFFNSEGNVDVFISNNGTETKAVTISADQPMNEVKLDATGKVAYTKSSAKNVKFIEGRGNTVLATIGEVTSEAKQANANGKMDTYLKANYKNIVPGDMIKVMLGNIEPLAINIDYSYVGDNYGESLMSVLEQSQKATTPAAAIAEGASIPPAAPTTVKPFDGNLKLNDFSIWMGDAGISINANLQFKKDNAKLIPTGEATLKIAQYQKLIDYLSKFFPVPKEEVDKTIQFFSEVGENSNGNLTFIAKLDGTENVLINGKTLAEVKQIDEKYKSQSGAISATEPSVQPMTEPVPAQAAKPAAVTAKPLAVEAKPAASKSEAPGIAPSIPSAAQTPTTVTPPAVTTTPPATTSTPPAAVTPAPAPATTTPTTTQ